MVVQGVNKVDASIVKSYARDLHNMLEEAEISEKKAFLKSFIKKITVDGDEVTVNYRSPLPDKSKDELALTVLLIDTLGGAGVTIGRTFSISFGLGILIIEQNGLLCNLRNRSARSAR